MGCQDAEACNYNSEATDPGVCLFATGCETCSGQTDGTGVIVDNDADNDGVCDADEITGCTDATACNYDATPTTDTDNSLCDYPDGICDTCSGETDGTGVVVDNDADDDGVCDADEITGCTDAAACNYDATPTTDTDNSLCIYADFGYNCDDECLEDADDDGVCDPFEIPGCDDATAFNYDASATDNDGSCIYEGCTSNCACNYDPVASVDDGSCEYDCLEGCVYETALNYDASASIDDGSCQFQGCMDASYSNYNPVATVQTEGDCSNEPASADLSPDGEVQLEDLLNFLQAFGLAGAEVNDLAWANGCYVEPTSDEDLLATVLGCEGEDCCTVGGCSYPSALNYNPDALIDHGVCLFPGCTDSTAFNYDALANVDDNSCVYNACPDFNGDGLIQVIDLMDLLLVWGTTY